MKKKRAMSNSRDPEYTPEEDEAWKVLESKIPKEELERIERDSKRVSPSRARISFSDESND